MVASIYAHNGGQYSDSGFMLLDNPLIMQDAKPKIMDAPLTVIFGRISPCSCLDFCLSMRPIL